MARNIQPATIRFSGKKVGSSWTVLTLPKRANAKLHSSGGISRGANARAAMMVEGTINNLPFRAALETDGKGGYQLKISKAMRDAMGIADLDTVVVEIARVGDEPETRVPVDLRKALATTPRAQAAWSDITPMARRDWIFSITSSKQTETRQRRIEKTRDMLATGHRRLCCFPGIKWLMEKNAKSCGMWLPLGNAKSRSGAKAKK
jgi:hypothetical protein